MNACNDTLDEAYSKMSVAISKELDEEILVDQMAHINWIIIRNRFNWEREQAEIWMKENLKGSYRISNSACAFESEEDASVFALKWL